MELRGAVASHVGNVRESNQDRAHFGGFVAAVADGMGGHQGGEMAASIAISEFLDVVDPIAPGGLVELVEDANRAVFERAADPDLRGMGTTLVALTLRPSEEKVSVVNVGDSRAYFLRGSELGQVTNDHSLVEDLVRQNKLTPEEALTHPQRNILTRALGIASEVEVDRFLIPAKVGDRFLLCSDGLFNEVSEDDIIHILADREEPNEAADDLVAAALAAAGRDNVTVAVIDVVPDGGGANVSSDAAETLLVPAVGGPSNSDGDPISDDDFDPEDLGSASGAGRGPSAHGGPPPVAGLSGGGGVATDITQVASVTSVAGIDEFDTAHAEHDLPSGDDYDAAYDEVGIGDLEPELDDEELALGHSPVDTGEVEVVTPRRRRRRLVWMLVPLLLGIMAGAVYVGVNAWADRQWFVDQTDGGQVAVFRGVPGGFLWTEPSQTVVGLDDVNMLTNDAQNEVLMRRDFASQADAEAFITDLERAPDEEALNDALNDAADAAEAVATDQLEDVADQIDPTDESTPEGAGNDNGSNQGVGSTNTSTNTTAGN